MSLARFEHDRVLVEAARNGPEALDSGLDLRLCHAEARLECLADPDQGTPIERETWLGDASDLLQEADTLAQYEAITNTIRDARQLLEDPVICERATRIHADGCGHLDDRAMMSEWYAPTMLLLALLVYCIVSLAIATGGVPP